MTEKQTTQEQAARRIAGLLANAEDAAKRGALGERDAFLQKATALQHKYAIDQIMLERNDSARTEEIISEEFCHESNTPLVKAKRLLLQGLATLYRGTAALCGEWDPVKRKMNNRAYVRVWAHTSDLAFISQMYTSLILQMQTEMARDERKTHDKVTNAWRVSYAHAWVERVYYRLWDLKRAQERETQATGTGAEMVLRDKATLVHDHADREVGGFAKGRRHPTSDKNPAGRAAGDAAGRRADLGQNRVAEPTRRALDPS